MATTVQVLCLNGHRQNVKINNNTTMLQVLEDVCKKQGFLPSSDYNLLHGRKVLDLTLSFRFSNLPNNVKLELVKSKTSREISNVHIALNAPNGERLEEEFSPFTTLWNILSHWDDKLQRPFVSHFARVDTTSIQPLHPVCIHMSEEVVGTYALQNTTLHHLGLTSGRALIRLAYRPVDEVTISEIHKAVDIRKKYEAKPEQSTRTKESSLVTTYSFITCQQHPSLHPDPDAVSYNAEEPDDTEKRSEDKHDASTSSLDYIRSLPTHSKPHILDHQSEKDDEYAKATKGQDLYHNEHQDVNIDEFQPCDRESVVFSLDNVKPSEQVHLPEDFFDVTEIDLKYMMEEQKRQIDNIENQPLMTRSMRVLNQEYKADKYKFAVVRIHFPDKYVLQGKFTKQERIYSLYKFVKEHLENKNQDFYLYETPPKTILKDFTRTMIQAKFVPAAIVYFGCHSPKEHYLSEEAMTRMRTPDVAFSIASINMSCSDDSNIQSNSIHKHKKEAGKVVPKWFTMGKK